MASVSASQASGSSEVRFVEPGQTTEPAAKKSEAMANQDVFMKLLIAQLKYQNPMDPADGAEYISQLTQFSQLEQTTKSQQELESIRKLLESMSAAAQTTSGGTESV